MSEREDHRLIWVLTGLGALIVVGGIVGAVVSWHRFSQAFLGSGTPLAAQRAVANPAPSQPLPSGPGAKTWRDYDAARLDFSRATLAEAYKQAGHRNPAWDQRALDLLELYAQGTVSLTPSGNDKLVANAQALIAAGCDDPLVLNVAGICLANAGKVDDAEPLMRRAIEGYQQTKYPRSRAWIGAWQMTTIERDFIAHHPGISALEPPAPGKPSPQPHSRVAPYQQLMREWLGQAVTEQDVLRGRQRGFWFVLNKAFGDGLTDPNGPIFKLLTTQRGADPWIVAMLQGTMELNSAWNARGSGWASSVSSSGWAGFSEHLLKAHQYLTQAYTLHPEYPEAASLLISVTMGEPQGGETPRLWFDRAVAAQFDWGDAYDRYRNAIMPRWEGSHEEMYQFGLDCLATKRFDTCVPENLLEVASQITRDDGDQEFWQQPGVWEHLQEMFEGYLAVPHSLMEPRDLKNRYLVVAYLSGHKDVAARLLNELNGQLDSTILGDWGLVAATVKSDLQVSQRLSGSQAGAADQAYQDGDLTRAAALYRKVIQQMPAGDPALAHLRDQVECCRLEAALQKDGWVDLTPAPDFVGWNRSENGYLAPWSIPAPDTIQGPSSNHGGRLWCKMRTPPRYELRGEVDLPLSSSDASILLGEPKQAGWGTDIQLWRGQDLMVNGGPLSGTLYRGNPTIIRDQNEVVAQVWDGMVTVYVNGFCPVSRGRMVAPDADPPAPTLGLDGQEYMETKPAPTFRHLRMRRLTSPPTPPTAES
jgi:hypothetical protein